MIGLFCFVLAFLASPFKSKLGLEAANAVVRNGGRLKKAAIVALARKLLVALWKYVAAGVVIEGAIMKAV